MIIATIQSKQTGGSYPNTSAVNGEILDPQAAQPYINRLYALIKNAPSSLDGEGIIALSGHFLCVQYHPERDDKNRIRPALILWSSDEHIENLTPTLEAMGLDPIRFRELYEHYQAVRWEFSRLWVIRFRELYEHYQASLYEATQRHKKRILVIAGIAAGIIAIGAMIYLANK